MVRFLSSVCPTFFAALALLACAATTVCAETPGDVDLSFETGSSVDGAVYAVVSAGDGKVYIGGAFTSVRGVLRNRIARLNADGSVDATFDPGTGANGIVRCLALQSNGKILIGGEFGSYNAWSRNYIARLNADGSFDTSFFAPGAGANGVIQTLALQSDGKVLVGGISPATMTCHATLRV